MSCVLVHVPHVKMKITYWPLGKEDWTRGNFMQLQSTSYDYLDR